MTDAWLLVQWEEGYFRPAEAGHIICSTVQDDYYIPIVVCKTREDLVNYLDKENVTWNGDTVTIERFNWKGERKYTDTYYAIPVEFGKLITY